MTATELKPVAWTSHEDIALLDLYREHIKVLNATFSQTPAHDVPLILKSEADTTIADLRAEVERLREALQIIAGERQCVDNLMGNVDIARAALNSKKGAEDGN